jgi:long-chain acyl-CoA synthetase
METLQDFLPLIEHLGAREAIRWSNGYVQTTATYSDLHSVIATTVALLDERGIRKGDRALIWAENNLSWVAAFWACVARGVEVVPVDFRFSPELVNRICTECQPRIVFDRAVLDKIAASRRSRPFQPTAVSGDDIVEIVYTSGTTGDPKGVIHRHRNICSNLRPFQSEIAKYRKWATPFQPVRLLDLLPLSHMFGQSLGIFIPVLLGGAAAFTAEIRPAKLLQIIHDNRISVVAAVPRILENLKNEVERRFVLRPAVRSLLRRFWRYRKVHFAFGWKFWAFVAGGARVDTELEEFWGRLGFLVVQGYGLTEASPVVAVNHPFNAKRGSLGKVVPGQDVMIAADGELLVRGESVTTEGWLHTGDLGDIDADGRLYYRGRKKDVIVTPDGLNVFPDDVEAVLNQLPGIRESAVVGIRREGREEVHAALVLDNAGLQNGEVEELVRRANAKLEAHQRIKGWSVWPEAELPRTPSTMKVKRGEIATRLASGPSAGDARRRRVDLSALSSLERVELLSELENKYALELNEEEFSNLQTTEQLDEWLRHVTQEMPVAARQRSRSGRPPSDWARSLPFRMFRAGFRRLVANPLFRHYLPLTVSGLAFLDELKPPVIFAANHTSHLDTPALYAALPYRWQRRLAPAMSQDFFRAYFQPKRAQRGEMWRAAAGYFLACGLFNAYPLPQEMSGARRAFDYTGELVKRGFCPLVYPEGMRTPDGKLHPFRPGVGMMASRLQVPVVPVRISGLYEAYSLRDNWPKRGPVHVAFGTPLVFGSENYAEIAGQIEHAVEKL